MRRPNKILPDRIRLIELFKYSDGNLIHRTRHGLSGAGAASWNTRYAGKVAGSIHKATGYKRVGIDGGSYMAHRIIFKMFFNSEPEQIDHISGVRTENRIENLRTSCALKNQHNRVRNRNNTSGVSGVIFNRASGKWRAVLSGKHLGSYDSFDEAVSARMDKEIENLVTTRGNLKHLTKRNTL